MIVMSVLMEPRDIFSVKVEVLQLQLKNAQFQLVTVYLESEHAIWGI